MSAKKKIESVIAICIQEPTEEGSSMDLGPIKGDDLRFLHQAFITDTIRHALHLAECDVRLYYIDQSDRRRLVEIVTEYLAGKLNGKTKTAFDARFTSKPQKKDRFGKRVDAIFKECFGDGYKNVLVVGSRTPTVTPHMMQTALKLLKQSDAVFGPTPEGRYYIIGMTGSYQVKLDEFNWRSPSIYSEVANEFTKDGLRWSELEIWYCVEHTDELEIMARDINQYRFEGDEDTAHETEIVMERILAKLEP